jgi:hypothetical protein
MYEPVIVGAISLGCPTTPTSVQISPGIPLTGLDACCQQDSAREFNSSLSTSEVTFLQPLLCWVFVNYGSHNAVLRSHHVRGYDFTKRAYEKRNSYTTTAEGPPNTLPLYEPSL